MTSFTLRQRLPRTSGLFASFSFQGALVSLVFLSGNVVYYATLLLPCQPAFSFAACAASVAGCLGVSRSDADEYTIASLPLSTTIDNFSFHSGN